MTDSRHFVSIVQRAAASVVLLSAIAKCSPAQVSPVERVFPQSKGAVENALKKLQPAMSGRLPALEGFAFVGDHPLTRYQRAFYQCVAKVESTSSGGSVVRVSAKITAWYADPASSDPASSDPRSSDPGSSERISSRAGYHLLTSNGRLEEDLLDQLADQLKSSPINPAGSQSQPTAPSPAARKTPRPPAADDSIPSAPIAALPDSTGSFSPSPSKGGSIPERPQKQSFTGDADQKRARDLETEIAALEDALKNQAHPRNLVAIKKSGTPVVASPSLSGKTLFLASAHDEFELLDLNGDWVHVRISGLSRGWIWRTSLEMPEGIPDVPRPAAPSVLTAADIFEVSREETSPFPGDWEPLRGKNVKIISVQKIRENETDGGASAKLEFAKSLLDKRYDQLANSPELSGVVLIFDSADGGMIAATLPTIRRWKAGALTDAALWHQCYFDPPETFTVSSVTGSH